MTAPAAGWPTLADVHREVTAVRADLRGLCEEMRAQRRELDRHRADDRRELDALGSEVDSLRGRERWLAGGLAVLAALVMLAVPLAATLWGGR